MKKKEGEEDFRAFPQFQICHYTTDCMSHTMQLVVCTSRRNSKQTLRYFCSLQLPLGRHFERKQQRKLLRKVMTVISGSGRVKFGGEKAKSVWNARRNCGSLKAENMDPGVRVVRNLDTRRQLVSVWYKVL